MCPNCCKEYKDNSGLWRHKKKCIAPEQNGQATNQSLQITTDVVLQILKQNEELQKLEKLIKTLNLKEQQILRLHLAGYKNEEIAALQNQGIRRNLPSNHRPNPIRKLFHRRRLGDSIF